MEGLDHRENRVAAFRGLEVDLLQFVAASFSESDWQKWVGAVLERTALTGNADLFRRVLRASAIDVRTWRGVGGHPLLTSAVCGSNGDVVLAVLESGGEVGVNDRICESGGSALHHAAEGGYDEVSRVLITAGGANVDILDDFHLTPLHVAALHGHYTLAVDLLRFGAPLHRTDLHGNLPVHYAAKHGHGPIVSALLNTGRNQSWCAEATNIWGQTPLFWAVVNDHADVVVRLPPAGGGIHQLMPPEVPVIHIAAQTGYLEVLRALLFRGADAKATSHDGRTALHSAADGEVGYDSNQVEIVQMLLEAGVDADSRDSGMWTPLHCLCSRSACQVDSLRVLLQAGAGVNAVQNNGETPLHIACAHLNVEAAKILLDGGADLAAEDTNGNTPAQVVGSSIPPGNEGSAATLASKTARILDLLAKAPKDRAWRRRSWLVMCRHRGIPPPPPDDDHTQRNKRAKTNEGASVGVGGGGDECEESSATAPDPFEKLATTVFTLDEDTFRTIASFL